MQEISLHILDISQNSVVADATLVEIIIDENEREDILDITIRDNGKGMDEEKVKKVLDPFFTTRSTRRVGLGIPMYREAALRTGGDFRIESSLGVGTSVFARFGYSHIDRQPLGDMAGALFLLITCNPEIDFVYTHTVCDKQFLLDTREIKRILDGVSISDIQVSAWLKEYINEGITNLYGGV